MKIEFCNLEAALGHARILRGVSLCVQPGKLTGVIGPNGCGKSTLIKTLFSIVKPSSGEILLDGEPTSRISPREIAMRIGYVSQESNIAFNFTVRELIRTGRYPHRRALRRSEADKVVDDAIAAMHLEAFASRSILTLSGGEKKMVYLARTIAQQVECIVLDEPTNHLDIRHQLFILDYLKSSGKTVLIVMHDLSLATRYCDTLYLMQSGKVVAGGAPEEVLTEQNVHSVFGVEGHAFLDEHGKRRFELT